MVARGPVAYMKVMDGMGITNPYDEGKYVQDRAYRNGLQIQREPFSDKRPPQGGWRGSPTAAATAAAVASPVLRSSWGQRTVCPCPQRHAFQVGPSLFCTRASDPQVGRSRSRPGTTRDVSPLCGPQGYPSRDELGRPTTSTSWQSRSCGPTRRGASRLDAQRQDFDNRAAVNPLDQGLQGQRWGVRVGDQGPTPPEQQVQEHTYAPLVSAQKVPERTRDLVSLTGDSGYPADFYARAGKQPEFAFGQEALRIPQTPQVSRLRSVCPTPFILGPVCGRGERELPGWRNARDSNEILGTCADMMAQTAKYIVDVISSPGHTMRLLSAADGCADDTQTDAQARYVPTSVMLAHSLAMSGAWPDLYGRVRVFGADVRNALIPWWLPQDLPWRFPGWIEHRFLSLDNTRDFESQLYATAQCEEDLRFDVVLLRQGLCFCDDPSKTSLAWPREVSVVCERAMNVAVGDPAAVGMAALAATCGVYQLEPLLFEGRPSYRRGGCFLRWCSSRLEWAILDSEGGAWAYARGDLGHPALARGPWTVWDGTNHVVETTFSCNLVQPASTPPWQRPPSQRICCCGVPGDAGSVLQLLLRIATILDCRNPDSFCLLHGAWTNGTQTEVDQLHQQLEDAVRLFNERRAFCGLPHAACVLWRTAAKEYWLQCDGIVLFQPDSRSDPFRAFGISSSR